jgi:hypothetical protein
MFGDPTAGLDDVEKKKFLTLPGLELRPLGRPARSQSLFRLRYPGFSFFFSFSFSSSSSSYYVVSFFLHVLTL